MRKPKAIWIPTMAAAAMLYALAAAADCILPSPPSHIPSANFASEQEMMASMHTLKKYNDDVTEYTLCLDFQHRQNRISIEDYETHRKVALDTLTTVTARFNEQVRLFKARHS